MHLPFTTMGSGSLAAMGVLETKFKDNLSQSEGIELVKEAIEAGIFHDLGSGSNVDIFVVRRDGCEKMESYRVYNQKVFTQSDTYKFPKGTTPILEETKNKWKYIQVEDDTSKMDIY
jgi:20S proteasome subunit beta 2